MSPTPKPTRTQKRRSNTSFWWCMQGYTSNARQDEEGSPKKYTEGEGKHTESAPKRLHRIYSEKMNLHIESSERAHKQRTPTSANLRCKNESRYRGSVRCRRVVGRQRRREAERCQKISKYQGRNEVEHQGLPQTAVAQTLKSEHRGTTTDPGRHTHSWVSDKIL